ncbi:MAG TPA: hypothetical protein VFF33_08505 [Ignavibacteriaceae bacterium]|nr:hypothetical protein [Ignavibacteriaceae bacterium]
MILRKISGFIFLLLLLSTSTLNAQFYFFGRNKVQFDKFEWKVLKTRHFDVYFYNEMEELAEIGGFYAEEAYNEYKVKFNHTFTRRIPLIFYNTSLHFQQTNTTPGFIPEGVGGFFEFLKGRVVIPSTGSLTDFRHVIRHELAHVFMTNKVYNVLADRRLPTDALPPLWFVEGFAEYMSTKVDAQAEMVMRDAVINNYFVGLDNIYQIYGTFIMYKEGQNFLEFVSEKYGEEKIILLLENFWMYTNFNKVIEHTIGKKFEDIDAEWQYYNKVKYYPLIKDKAPQKYLAKKVSKDGYYFSPVFHKNGDGNYLYFQGNNDGYSSLFKMKIGEEEQEEPELILRGEKTEEFEAFHLFSSALDISKKGIIAFVTKSGATDALHLFDTKSEKVIHSYQSSNLISMSSPKFSSDDNLITFNAIDQKGFSDIYIYDIDKDSVIRLTNDYYDDKDPEFGKTDNTIIFSSDRTSGEYKKKYNLFTIDTDNLSIRYLTYINADNVAPVLSEDKNTLLFTSNADTVFNIWKMDLSLPDKENKIEKVTSFLTSSFNPVFMDSSKICFSGFEELSFNLYTLDLKDKKPDNVITMNYDSVGTEWKEGQLSLYSEKEKLNYEKEYTLDYAQSQISTDPVFGTRGGAVFSLSDLFGNDNYFFLVYNTADVQSDFLKSFNVQIQRIDLSERSNYGYGVFHFSGRRYDIRESDEYYFERSYGGFFILNFPISKFQRIETSISIANSDKQVLSSILERKALLVSNSISWVADNSIWGPTGPLDGIRARLLLAYTGDVKYSNVNYYSVIADYRQYFRIGLRSAIAFRSAFFFNQGKEARRYFMGGSWDLRGWPRWGIRGEKMWLSSLELRVPLIDQIAIRFPFVDLGFFGIRAAAFMDAGSAWDDQYGSTLGSVGAGVRINLFNALVFRYDIGKKLENNMSKLQKGLFYQFFFGWDF